MAEFSGTLPRFPVITLQMPLPAGDATVEPSDQDLMRRTAAGDRDAFAEIYRRHHPGVYRFARLMTGSGAMAEDAVQEVFLVLMRSAARYDASRSTLSSYLFGIARHYTRRRLSRERRFVGLDEQEAARCLTAVDGPQAGVERQHDLERLRCAVLALPSRYREVIVLCDLQDVSYAEAAATIGCAVGTIRSRLHRARQLLAGKVRRRAAFDGCRITRSPERYAV